MVVLDCAELFQNNLKPGLESCLKNVELAQQEVRQSLTGGVAEEIVWKMNCFSYLGYQPPVGCLFAELHLSHLFRSCLLFLLVHHVHLFRDVCHVHHLDQDLLDCDEGEVIEGKKKQSHLGHQTDCFLPGQFGKSWMKNWDRSTHDVIHHHNCNTCNYTKPVFDMYLALSGFYRQFLVLDTLNSNCIN